MKINTHQKHFSNYHSILSCQSMTDLEVSTSTVHQHDSTFLPNRIRIRHNLHHSILLCHSMIDLEVSTSTVHQRDNIFLLIHIRIRRNLH